MLVIGISGQTGAGKSTLARYLSRFGGKNLEVDEVGHDLLFDKNVKKHLKKNFGSEIFDSSGEVCRQNLGKKAFQNADSITTLNRIMHPPMIQAILKEIKAERASGRTFILVNAALLFSMGLSELCDVIIFVVATPEIRLERLVESRGMDKDKAEQRLFAQDNIPENCKKLKIINNDSNEEDLFSQADDFMKQFSLYKQV